MDAFLLAHPDTFYITSFQQHQNPFLNTVNQPNKTKGRRQHAALVRALPNAFRSPFIPHNVPDLIFAANWGLPLPCLPKPTVILASMKYKQRQREEPIIRTILEHRDIICLPPLPTVFEGQAELKWFHGGLKAIQGYGFRSTAAAVPAIRHRLHSIYQSYGLPDPEILALKQIDPALYHLDLCILEVDSHKCLVMKQAFSPHDIERIKAFLGPSNVLVLDTPDLFLCNSIVLKDKILVNKSMIPDPATYRQIEAFTNKKIHVLDTSEFNKSGGGIRCMVLTMEPL
jgi:N-dimethylarginine dimethylaminohydrolase